MQGGNAEPRSSQGARPLEEREGAFAVLRELQVNWPERQRALLRSALVRPLRTDPRWAAAVRGSAWTARNTVPTRSRAESDNATMTWYSPQSMAASFAADCDLDGDLDFVAMNLNHDATRIHWNDGNGVFAVEQTNTQKAALSSFVAASSLPSLRLTITRM